MGFETRVVLAKLAESRLGNFTCLIENVIYTYITTQNNLF